VSVRLAVFDCDGTLSDGQAGVCAAMEAAFAAVGLTPPDRHQVRRTVGLSLPHAVRRIAPEAPPHLLAAAVEAYKDAFRRTRRAGMLSEPLYEGIAALLAHLKARGWLLGVATGKSDRGLHSCLAAHGIFDLFVTLQTADRHPSKPHPSMLSTAMSEAGADPPATVMIGDTAFDMAMARAAGVRAIGVAWGYHLPEELIEAGAEAIAQTPAELEYLLDAGTR
jgi:phosphoglycolate phosphatase